MVVYARMDRHLVVRAGRECRLVSAGMVRIRMVWAALVWRWIRAEAMGLGLSQRMVR